MMAFSLSRCPAPRERFFDSRGLTPQSVAMGSLHTLWQKDDIVAPRPPPADSSLFAAIAQPDDDDANNIVIRERTCFALLNAHPYAGGDLMVAPRK